MRFISPPDTEGYLFTTRDSSVSPMFHGKHPRLIADQGLEITLTASELFGNLFQCGQHRELSNYLPAAIGDIPGPRDFVR